MALDGVAGTGIGDAFVEIGVKKQKFRNDLDKSRVTLSKFAGDGQKKMARFGARTSASMGGVTHSVAQLRTAIGLLKFALAGLAVAGFGKMVKAAADAEEAASKFDVVFGDSAKRVGDEMDEFASKVNRSSVELRSLTGDTGDVVKALGLGEKEAAELSVALAKLAVDTASFKNVQEPQVIRAFTTALTGERESLKTLGVVISEANVQQKVFQMGLASTKAEITTSAKALATYELLTERLADAQGDAERTSGSFTNVMRGLGGATKDASVAMGDAILQFTDIGAGASSLTELIRGLQVQMAALVASGDLVKWREEIKAVMGQLWLDIKLPWLLLGELIGKSMFNAITAVQNFAAATFGIFKNILTVAGNLFSDLSVILPLAFAAAFAKIKGDTDQFEAIGRTIGAIMVKGLLDGIEELPEPEKLLKFDFAEIIEKNRKDSEGVFNKMQENLGKFYDDMNSDGDENAKKVQKDQDKIQKAVKKSSQVFIDIQKVASEFQKAALGAGKAGAGVGQPGAGGGGAGAGGVGGGGDAGDPEWRRNTLAQLQAIARNTANWTVFSRA